MNTDCLLGVVLAALIVKEGERIQKRSAEYYLQNKERIDSKGRKYQSDNAERQKAYRREWYERQGREARGHRTREKYFTDVKVTPEHKKKVQAEATRRHIQKNRRYVSNSRDCDAPLPMSAIMVIAARRREYVAWWKLTLKREKESKFSVSSKRRSRIARRLREHMRGFIKKPKRYLRSALIGCTGPEFRAHIEKQWQPGWTWKNYGKRWNIDHITPLARFDLGNEYHRRLASHWSNLRPMLAKENFEKQCRGVRHQPMLPLRMPPIELCA